MDHAGDAASDGGQGLAGGETVGTRFGDAGFDLLFEAGDSDFEELVEVAAGDAVEPEPFQQWVVGPEGFFQDAVIEFEPAQFAIEEVCGAEGCG
jgi:hypothetical protein